MEFKNFGGEYQTWKDGSFDVDRFFAMQASSCGI